MTRAPYVRKDRRAGGDEVAIVLVIFEGCMRQSHGRGDKPSMTLLDESINVGQLLAVGLVGQAVRADDGVELSLRFLLCLGIEVHCKEERQKRCQRLHHKHFGQKILTRVEDMHAPCLLHQHMRWKLRS